MMKRFFLFFSLIYTIVVSAQEDELHFMRGKVICENIDLSSVIIENQRSQSIVNPESNGNFSLFVKTGDQLVFRGLAVDTKTVEISKEDLSKKIVTITLFPKVIPLENVEIKTYPNINAVSLGILEKPAKKYTPAERRLAAAGEFHWYSPLLIPLGGMSVDGLINAISGRTAMLKKELEVEKKEMLLKKIEYQFDLEFFTNDLNIPQEYVKGFWYFAIEEPRLVAEINAKNKAMSKFIFAELATKYLELLHSQSK